MPEPLLLSVREKREYLNKHTYICSSRFPSRLFRGKQQVDLITCYNVWPGGLSLEMQSSYFLSWAVAFGSSIILPQPKFLEVSPSAHSFPQFCWNALFPCHKILHCGFGGHLEWSNSAEPTFRNKDWGCKCSSYQGSLPLSIECCPILKDTLFVVGIMALLRYRPQLSTVPR